MSEFWNDERVTLLRHEYGEGKSPPEIAALLGAKTVDVVKSKIHRLGLSSQFRVTKLAPRFQYDSATRVARRKALAGGRLPGNFRLTRDNMEPSDVAEYAQPVGDIARAAAIAAKAEIGCTAHAAIDALKENGCRHPHGDPLGTFAFCPGTRVAGTQYCATHALANGGLSARARARVLASVASKT